MGKISKVDIQEIAENFRSIEASRTAALEEKRHDALHEAFLIAEDFVRMDPAIRRILLFGSLARGEALTSEFDIDLAVESSPDVFLKLVSRALNSSLKVDVIDLQTADRHIRESIENNCVVLYEK